MSWESALQIVCNTYENSGKTFDWMIVGSVGSVLQGCDMKPGDLDIYTKSREGVEEFARLMSEYAQPANDGAESDSEWLSTKEEPVLHQTFPSGFSWSKARYRINHYEVEIVHIADSAGIPDSLTGSGIWEGGQYIWNLARTTRFRGNSIRMVPLEIQLESNLRRKREDRVQSILQTMRKKGYDENLIKKALSKDHYSIIKDQFLYVKGE
ncbi:hypothetical protein [Bacillus sp. Marseille-Q1617]|uniref:hypothetical protein n=1 Tax=Bacillus sp. Marseille-Q1617 TaxID=2736887 RepID=UPI00158D0366|nr:hypothetical protein [Bacillus sp. Marseille-Q1617]